MNKDENQTTVEVDEPLAEELEVEQKPKKKKTTQSKRKTSRGKVKKLENEKIKLEEELSQFNEKYLRLAAEFENFKKIMSKDADNRIRNIKEALILDILPVLDDLDRTLGAVSDEEKKSSIGNGVTMIRDNMKQILSNYGLKEITSIGEEFDVDLHEALMMAKDENFASNVVVQEHQKGYKLNDRVIRHAKVAVNALDEDE